jgi:hypothetical protein
MPQRVLHAQAAAVEGVPLAHEPLCQVPPGTAIPVTGKGRKQGGGWVEPAATEMQQEGG